MATRDSGLNKLDVLCFGGEDWWYHNRGHIDMQLMRRFARKGTTLYINSLIMQRLTWHRALGGGKSLPQKVLRKTRSVLRGLRRSDAGFWVYSPLSLPVHHISGLRLLNHRFVSMQVAWSLRRLDMANPVVWVACPVAYHTALAMRRTKLVYQRTDRFEEYPLVDAERIRSYDQLLKRHADLTLYVSRNLYDEERQQCRNAVYLDHGVDFELFAEAENDSYVPEDIRTAKHPIAGFFGGIDSHTSDIQFIEELVQLVPEYSFVFIGNASSDVNRLLRQANVRMLGQKPYEQVPHYGKCFDVAIMIWRRNQWIEGCNPIKLKEYLALGKPVVSTPFPQLRQYQDVVYQAMTPPEFAACMRRALVEDDVARVAARRERVRDATWDVKARYVLQALGL
jgi:glycosyltransferase involved in cell wall biosynthesis